MPAKVLWPERASLYWLMVQRAAIGASAFAAEYQSDPVDPTLCEWPAEYLDWPGIWFDKWPDKLTVKTLALDPSKGRDAKHGDYSAYVLYGRDQYGVEYVEADLARRPAERIVADGVELYKRFQPEGLAVEINQFQELLMEDFRRAFDHAGIVAARYGINNMVPKQVRIRRHGPYLSQRRVRFKARSPGTAMLVTQLRDFPNGDHDDGPDAFEMGRRLAIHLFNGRQGRQGHSEVTLV